LKEIVGLGVDELARNVVDRISEELPAHDGEWKFVLPDGQMLDSLLHWPLRKFLVEEIASSQDRSVADCARALCAVTTEEPSLQSAQEQRMDVKQWCKTKDGVQLSVTTTVQFNFDENRGDPRGLIEACVQNIVRSAMLGFDFNEAFTFEDLTQNPLPSIQKPLSKAILEAITPDMHPRGCNIMSALITEITPHQKVRDAYHAKRRREVAERRREVARADAHHAVQAAERRREVAQNQSKEPRSAQDADFAKMAGAWTTPYGMYTLRPLGRQLVYEEKQGGDTLMGYLEKKEEWYVGKLANSTKYTEVGRLRLKIEETGGEVSIYSQFANKDEWDTKGVHGKRFQP